LHGVYAVENAEALRLFENAAEERLDVHEGVAAQNSPPRDVCKHRFAVEGTESAQCHFPHAALEITLPDGGTPKQFLITNNTGFEIDTLTFTINITLPAGNTFQLWNAFTSGFNSSTNPFTLATIDGFNALSGTPCTGGGVFFGTPSGSPTCLGGLPATIVWSKGTGNGIAMRVSCWRTIRL